MPLGLRVGISAELQPAPLAALCGSRFGERIAAEHAYVVDTLVDRRIRHIPLAHATALWLMDRYSCSCIQPAMPDRTARRCEAPF